MIASGKPRDRLIAGLMFTGIELVHKYAISGVSNTPEGMFLYHASAVLADYLIIVIAANYLRGQLSYDIQNINLVAMVCNAIGFCLYMAYAPPDFYNLAIMGLGYVQMFRLIFMGRNDADYIGYSLVRGRYTLS